VKPRPNIGVATLSTISGKILHLPHSDRRNS
jgi:hypothetical protein